MLLAYTRMNSTSCTDRQTPWYPDTGATHHVIPNLSSLSISDESKGKENLIVGNGTGLKISHIGNISSPSKMLALKNVCRVPTITKPLLSIQKFCQDNHCFFEFHVDRCLVKDQVTKRTILQGTSGLGLYKLQGVLKRKIS